MGGASKSDEFSAQEGYFLDSRVGFFSVWYMFINDRSIGEVVIFRKTYSTGGLVPASKKNMIVDSATG